MVPDHPIARAAAFAPVTPRSLNPGDQRPPLAGQVEGISNLGWRPHPRAQPADPWCDILELAHHHNRTGANRSPHPFRFIGEDSIRAASHTNPKAIGLVTHFSAETNTLYLQPISFRTLTRSYLAFLRGRSEEHTSELQSLIRISYAVLCLKKKNKTYVCRDDITHE